ncbi:MAG: cobyric acid synthase [Duncaniella sp.]|nr:cobyric acid synthase [Muribaculum sp.]MCM1256074.1 cobyric acid synthase [Duncaniella sp.]
MRQHGSKKLTPIMLAGTGSDVGKSILATGLCRIFKQDGYSPAPFKAQNMALNSYATPDGFEIGRAQAVQAEAAGIHCCTDMNPLLLKPSGERTSQVVLNGKPIGNRDAYDYFLRDGREELRREVHQAFDRLASCYNPIIMEGAGSISELNLRDTDLVNMSMARYANAKVILVADIDRGGVFASAYGSIMLQSEDDRRRIAGIIINKFRGDMRLFESGRKLMEGICGVPVLGVVPYMTDIHIEEEDSVALSHKRMSSKQNKMGKVKIAVVLLKHISNYTDFDQLEHDKRVNLFYTDNPEDLNDVDIVIIPGTKSTLHDLYLLRKSGMAQAILRASDDGKTVFGICGGYQMMGVKVDDPAGIEGEISSLPGLGLLPMHTVMEDGKTTRQVRFSFLGGEIVNEGYEIHSGTTSPVGNYQPMNRFVDGDNDGCFVNDKCMGTYIHGILDNTDIVDYLLSPYLHSLEAPVVYDNMDYKSFKEEQYNLLAERMREYVDIDKLYEIMGR